MSAKKKVSIEPPRAVVSYGNAKVRLNLRGNGFVAVSYHEAGRLHNTTRTTWEAAVTWAKEKARQIDGATGSRWVTPAGAEQLAWLERIAGGTAEAAHECLNALEVAVKALGGHQKLRAAAEWYMEQGPGRVQHMTLHAAVEAFLEEYEAHHPSITVRGVKAELRSLTAAQPQLLLAEVTHQMLHSNVRRGGVAQRTVKNRLSYWVTFFNRAKANHWIPEDRKSPAEKVTKPKQVVKSPEIFTPDQGAQILTAVQARAPQHLPYLLIAGWLGCRPFECTRLLKTDFDFAQNLLHVRADVARKVMAERWIPITPPLSALLQQCFKAHRKAAPKREGHACRLRSQDAISELAGSIGITWSIDVLRHSRITYRLQETHDIGKVAEESGNSAGEIRASYKRPIPPGQWEKWMACLDAVEIRDWQPTIHAPWTAPEEKLLGTAADAQIAQRLQRSTKNVARRRQQLGIAAFSR